MYTNIETLWRTTIARNPDCWLAHNNLGGYLYNKGHIKEAMEHYQKAIQIDPNYAEAQNNLGAALAAEGQFDEAIENYHKAIQIRPDFAYALNNLGMALAARGQFDDAIKNYRKAIQISPNFADALGNLGAALTVKGRSDEALGYYRQALAIDPNSAGAQNNLGILLAKQGRTAEAIEYYQKAIELNPNRAEFYNNLGNLLATQGRTATRRSGNSRKPLQLSRTIPRPTTTWPIYSSPKDGGTRLSNITSRRSNRCQIPFMPTINWAWPCKAGAGLPGRSRSCKRFSNWIPNTYPLKTIWPGCWRLVRTIRCAMVKRRWHWPNRPCNFPAAILRRFWTRSRRLMLKPEDILKRSDGPTGVGSQRSRKTKTPWLKSFKTSSSSLKANVPLP